MLSLRVDAGNMPLVRPSTDSSRRKTTCAGCSVPVGQRTLQVRAPDRTTVGTADVPVRSIHTRRFVPFMRKTTLDSPELPQTGSNHPGSLADAFPTKTGVPMERARWNVSREGRQATGTESGLEFSHLPPVSSGLVFQQEAMRGVASRCQSLRSRKGCGYLRELLGRDFTVSFGPPETTW